MFFVFKNAADSRYIVAYWAFALGILLVSQQAVYSLSFFNEPLLTQGVVKSIIPVFTCAAIVFIIRALGDSFRQPIVYFLFFSISITSLFGLTKTLTGSHAESNNIFLFGLSFYTASLAYLTKTNRLSKNAYLTVANPLLLITGPIATAVRSKRHWRFGVRYRYFAPYLILGIFLHQAVATPLTETFRLIEKTDLASSVIFAAIFELFVYSNFCGLSLVIYGIFGLLGLKVPLNFRQPFSATNLVDFWRGWHVTLSTVLKALFYSPAKKAINTTAAVFAVFFSSAMWHGVTFNFVLWGAFHGACFVATIYLLRNKIKLFPTALMIFGVVIGRLLFSDSNTERILEKLTFQYKGLGTINELMAAPTTTKLALVLAALFVAAEFTFQKTALFRQRTYKFYRIPIIQLILLLITMVTVSSEVGVDFAVYGQR